MSEAELQTFNASLEEKESLIRTMEPNNKKIYTSYFKK